MSSWPFAAMAAAGCVIFGFSWAASLSRRVNTLKAWSRSLVRMEAGLMYHAQKLETLLMHSVDGEDDQTVRNILVDCAKRMRDSPLLSLEECMAGEAMTDLTTADKAALSPLWSTLGMGDEATQRLLLSSVRTALDAQIEQAKEQTEKNHRLAISLGLIGGGVVFLFLI